MATPVARALLAAVLVLALAGCSRPAGGPRPSPSPAALDPARPLPSPVPDVVARVNGQPIRIHQILPMAKAALDRLSIAERDARKPEVLRHALQQYVDRELILQEALARGIEADSREVDWAYDQLRREHANDVAWKEFLAGQGMTPQSFRAELRSQHTVAALLHEELRQAPGGEAGAAGDAEGADEALRQAEVQQLLLARLRAKARIELFL
ncbi:MAG TPA: SurA N-terminal domain-containing protein [Vicinamibacteria bacterium]|nr:SurA N-terminal domain-containing protein [Vicinamibacteria bacterium]